MFHLSTLPFYSIQQTVFAAVLTVSLFGFEETCYFEVADSAADGGRRELEVSGYSRDGCRPTFVVFVRLVGEIDIYRNGPVRQLCAVKKIKTAYCFAPPFQLSLLWFLLPSCREQFLFFRRWGTDGVAALVLIRRSSLRLVLGLSCCAWPPPSELIGAGVSSFHSGGYFSRICRPVFPFVGIPDLTVALVGYGIGIIFVKPDAPFEEQLEVYPHGCTGFHDYKIALGQGFEFIRRQQWTPHHLERLWRIVFTSADRSAHDRAAAECWKAFRQSCCLVQSRRRWYPAYCPRWSPRLPCRSSFRAGRVVDWWWERSASALTSMYWTSSPQTLSWAKFQIHRRRIHSGSWA